VLYGVTYDKSLLGKGFTSKPYETIIPSLINIEKMV
jgi:hypothetical protein